METRDHEEGTMSKHTPKPCPFCTSEVVSPIEVFFLRWLWTCQCKGCAAQGPTRKSAIASIVAWNKRKDA